MTLLLAILVHPHRTLLESLLSYQKLKGYITLLLKALINTCIYIYIYTYVCIYIYIYIHMYIENPQKAAGYVTLSQRIGTAVANGETTLGCTLWPTSCRARLTGFSTGTTIRDCIDRDYYSNRYPLSDPLKHMRVAGLLRISASRLPALYDGNLLSDSLKTMAPLWINCSFRVQTRFRELLLAGRLSLTFAALDAWKNLKSAILPQLIILEPRMGP